MTELIVKEINKNQEEIDRRKQEIEIRELLILELRAVLGRRESPFS